MQNSATMVLSGSASGRSPNPVASVIIPFFRTPAVFLKEAIASVLNQTLGDWELLLVDDGAPRDSQTVALNHASMHPGRIRYLHHDGFQNLGTSASRNLGIDNARGEYIGLLDADDIWLRHKLEQQISILQSHPDCGMVYGNTLYWHSWERTSLRRDYEPRLGLLPGSIVPPPQLLPRFLEGSAAVPSMSNILTRNHIVRKLGGFDYRFRSLYDDQVFLSKICATTPVLVMGTTWDQYRQHPDSVCSMAADRQTQRIARLCYLKWLQDYLAGKEISAPDLHYVLKREIQLCEAPGRPRHKVLFSYLLRRSRKLWRRLRQQTSL